MTSPLPAQPDAMLPWWQQDASLARFIADQVAADLAALRPGGTPLAPRPWQPNLQMGPGGLAMDSLELMSVATGLTEALHLHRSGVEDYLLMHRRFGDWCQIAARALTVFDRQITFRTSGSTGAPKPCIHDLAGLEAEIRVHAGHLPPVRRIIGLVPAHHIYGFLFTILLPQLLNVPYLDACGRLPGRVAADMGPGDLLVAVPEQWALLARAASVPLAGRAGVCSTGPLDAGVFQALKERGLCLMEIYGSSETAGIGWRLGPDDPFRLLETLRLSDDGARLLRGWDGVERALPDHVIRVDNGSDGDRFHLKGRLDGAIQIGGINVFPNRVAAMLRGHPNVSAVAVRPLQTADGLRLKAFIVPIVPDDAAQLAASLTDWAETNLRPAERPRSWDFGSALPVNAMGKATDW